MFEKNKDLTKEATSVFRPSKGSSKVVIGENVTIEVEITNASEVQIDGVADVVLKTDNLTVGSSGFLKGTAGTSFKSAPHSLSISFFSLLCVSGITINVR